jgi:enamidase
VRRLVVYTFGAIALLVAAGAAWYFATLYRPGPAHTGTLALTGATVLVGPDLEPRPATTVLVERGVITAVGAAEADIPPDATVVDLTGTTLLPGLIDMHVHLGAPEGERGAEMGPLQVPGAVADAVRFVPGTRRALLAHGVTTVRSLGDDHAWVLQLREGIRDGTLEGPRVFAAGPLFTAPGGHPVVTIGVDPQGDGVRLPATPDEARRMVHAVAADGVDLIKVVQERGGRKRRLEPIAPDVLTAIVATAHERDLPVTAHWGSPQDLADVLAAGVDGLEHVESRGALDRWPGDAPRVLVERGIALTPTLSVTEVALPPDVHRRLRQRVAEFYTAGGHVVVGSDAGMPGVPFGGGVHRELELLVDSGLTPREALEAATSAAAQVMRAPDIGVIAHGHAADLVAVRGDPLTDISAVRDVEMVLRDGRIVVDHRQ